MWLTVRILAWRVRRLGAVLALGALALVAAHLAAPPAPRTQAVVVAARDVPSGTELTAADLRVVRLPAGLVPDSASPEPGALRGRVTATALPRGLPVVAQALTAGRFAVAPPAGSAVLALDVEPGVLAPGDRVDLVAVGCVAGGDLGKPGEPGTTATVAESALVVDVAEGAVAVAAPPEAGRAIAAAASGCTLRALLRT